MPCIDRRFKIGDSDYAIAEFWADTEQTVPIDVAADYTWVRAYMQLDGGEAIEIQWTTEAGPPSGYQAAVVQNTNQVVFPITAALSAALCVGVYKIWTQTKEPSALLPVDGIVVSYDSVSFVEVYE